MLYRLVQFDTCKTLYCLEFSPITMTMYKQCIKVCKYHVVNVYSLLLTPFICISLFHLSFSPSVFCSLFFIFQLLSEEFTCTLTHLPTPLLPFLCLLYITAVLSTDSSMIISSMDTLLPLIPITPTVSSNAFIVNITELLTGGNLKQCYKNNVKDNVAI